MCSFICGHHITKINVTKVDKLWEIQHMSMYLTRQNTGTGTVLRHIYISTSLVFMNILILGIVFHVKSSFYYNILILDFTYLQYTFFKRKYT